MRNRPADSAARGRTDPVLLVMAGVLFAGAAGVAAYVVTILRRGVLDARPRHAPPTEPMPLTAADEPFWFYAIVAALVVLAIFLLVTAWRMQRHARNPR